jgi:glutathione peroxidase
MAQEVYDFTIKDIKGDETTLADYKDKVILIVNVASKCGFTNQYTGLQKLQDELKDKGFSVLGFPCNQFGGQEPGTEEEIKSFCETSFSVNFPLYSKIDVNGSDASPLYEYLKSEAPGLMGSKAVKWNFTKFLVDKQGDVIKRFAPTDKPEDIKESIITLLD